MFFTKLGVSPQWLDWSLLLQWPLFCEFMIFCCDPTLTPCWGSRYPASVYPTVGFVRTLHSTVGVFGFKHPSVHREIPQRRSSNRNNPRLVPVVQVVRKAEKIGRFNLLSDECCTALFWLLWNLLLNLTELLNLELLNFNFNWPFSTFGRKSNTTINAEAQNIRLFFYDNKGVPGTFRVDLNDVFQKNNQIGMKRPPACLLKRSSFPVFAFFVNPLSSLLSICL